MKFSAPFFSLLAAALLIFSSPAFAQLTNADASSFKSVVDNFLAKQKELASKQGGSLQTSGPVTVTPSGNYLKARLPGLVLTDENGQNVDFGTVMMNSRPTNEAGIWDITLALTDNIKIRNKDGQQTNISLGTQNFSGKWRDSNSTLSSVKGNYGNIEVKRDNGEALTIGNLAFSHDLRPAGNQSVSGPFTFSMDNVKASNPVYTPFSPARIAGDANFTKVPLEKLLTAVAEGNGGILETALVNAGSSLNLSSFTLSSPDFNADLSGTANADVNSPYGYILKSQGNITGLDSLISKISNIRFANDPEQSALQNKLLATLTILQIAGQKNGNSNTRNYNIEVTRDGKILANGMDLSLLMRMQGR
tara:strand:- start:1100 stop:2188 length:1089 start_codon:yes stop_codon:yes gene_type:complete